MGIFFWYKGKMANVILEIFFSMSPDVPAFKVLIFTSYFKFWTLIVIDILTQIYSLFKHSSPYQFCEKYKFVVDGFSLMQVIM